MRTSKAGSAEIPDRPALPAYRPTTPPTLTRKEVQAVPMSRPDGRPVAKRPVVRPLTTGVVNVQLLDLTLCRADGHRFPTVRVFTDPKSGPLLRAYVELLARSLDSKKGRNDWLGEYRLEVARPDHPDPEFVFAALGDDQDRRR
jgi:hypothetical protein